MDKLALLKNSRNSNEPSVAQWLQPLCLHCELELRPADEIREGFHLYCYLQTQAWNAAQALKKFEKRTGKKAQEQMRFLRCYQRTRKQCEQRRPKIVNERCDGGRKAA